MALNQMTTELTSDHIIASSKIGKVRYNNMDQVLENYLAKLGRSRGLIYVGANTGQELPLCKQWADKIYAFEPINTPSVWDQLIQHQDDNTIALNFALSDKASQTVMYPSSNNFESSSLYVPGTHLNEFWDVAFGGPIPVETRRLDSFDFVPSCDCLIMDVQGAELDVLKGLTNFSNFKLIILEYISADMYINACTFNQLDKFLSVQGFVHMESFGLYNNPATTAYAANAVFVRIDQLAKVNPQVSRKALVLGAGGFIGSHMVKKLAGMGYWVRGVDIKTTEFSSSAAHDFVVGDLRDSSLVQQVMVVPKDLSSGDDMVFDEIYQFAADMGGAGFVFTGEHDADIMHNSASINLNVLDSVVKQPSDKKPRIFYSSSACIYPSHNQEDPLNPNCEESSAYPANPDSEYGWEKLFSERLYLAYAKNHGLEVRVARYIFGPEGTWQGGREKAPAAICRKVAEATDALEVWGSGQQTRSFLYIDECIEGTLRLMHSDHTGPVNIGSEEMVSINQLVSMVCDIAGKQLQVNHIPGPIGVQGRNSDNSLIEQLLGWKPSGSLQDGLCKTYKWISQQINKSTN